MRTNETVNNPNNVSTLSNNFQIRFVTSTVVIPIP